MRFPGIDYWCNVCTGITAIQCSSKIIELISQYKQSVVAIDTKAYQEASLLTNSKSYVYDPLDETKYVLTSTDYIYNEENLAPKEKTTISSKDEILKTAYKYPHDNTGNTVYSTMLSRNILSPVLEEQHYMNSSFLQSTKTNYDFWNGSAWSNTPTNIIAPRTVETQSFSSGPEVRLRYISYDDNGSVISVSKENDVKKAYIWAYNKNYPIAEVLNAEAKDVFHTSFEDAEGNAQEGKTGRKSHTGGYSKVLPNLTNGTYVLSWWEKNGSTWNLQVNTNISVTNSTFTINLPGQVDEVRFYPAKAQMTTLTHEPLVGITSQTDVNNRITYYEYDGLNRLIIIRDQDKNIVKRICYNFAGQPDDCTPCPTAPAWTNTATTQCEKYDAPPFANTGRLLQEQKDTNPCSGSYNSTRWIYIGCSASCPNTVPDWAFTGNKRCVKDASNNNTGELQREMVDINECGPSHGALKWYSEYNCTECTTPTTTPNWKQTGNIRCVKDASNNNTGGREHEEKNMNPCSTNFGEIRWIFDGQNCTSCPITTCTAANQKVVNCRCENGFKNYVSSVYVKTSAGWKWKCTYFWCFPDGIGRPERYEEYNDTQCSVGGMCLE